jgi:23S rRNA (uracil1939-C5)-methyltransferase
MARDLDHFARLGYAAGELQPVDMIPLTDQVETIALLERTTPPPARILYEDEEVRVVEKAAHQQPTSSTGDGARPVWAPSADTSGPALHIKAMNLATTQHQTTAPPTRMGELHRAYLALVRGKTAKHGRLPGDTSYERLAVLQGHALLRLTTREPETHIRRALARAGHPVVGDRVGGHGPTNRHFEERYTLDRPFLHCVELQFESPRTGRSIEVESALPGDLTAVLTRLGYMHSM